MPNSEQVIALILLITSFMIQNKIKFAESIYLIGIQTENIHILKWYEAIPVIPCSPMEHKNPTLQLQDNTLHMDQESSLMSQLTVKSTN